MFNKRESLSAILSLTEELEVMKYREKQFGAGASLEFINNIHNNRRHVLETIVSWLFGIPSTNGARGTIGCTIKSTSMEFGDAIISQLIDNVDVTILSYVKHIYRDEVKKFYNDNYPYTKDRQSLDEDINIFKLSCNIESEYVYAIMCMDSFLEHLLKILSEDTYGDFKTFFKTQATCLNDIEIDDTIGSINVDPIQSLVTKLTQTASIRHKVKDGLVDSILNDNRGRIMDTSPVWVYMSVHG